MIVGTEWLIEAEGCDADSLRDMKILREVFARIIADLGLKTISEDLASIRGRKRHHGFSRSDRISSGLSYLSRI